MSEGTLSVDKDRNNASSFSTFGFSNNSEYIVHGGSAALPSAYLPQTASQHATPHVRVLGLQVR